VVGCGSGEGTGEELARGVELCVDFEAAGYGPGAVGGEVRVRAQGGLGLLAVLQRALLGLLKCTRDGVIRGTGLGGEEA
jgi:hypothetical protein